MPYILLNQFSRQKRKKRILRRPFGVLVTLLVVFTFLSAQTGIPTGSSELGATFKKLNVLGSALYVAAHPDDENTAVIAALANGRMVRTAYLSMTRGEGGQNLLGTEQGAALGILRTQELLEARKIDGGTQFFTRAIDFGYSKTSEETIRLWGRERIVGDIVWVIRSFRPDVIITRFADTLGTHGNHTSSAILARQAFHAAADPAQFPEQLKLVEPWQAKRIVFNTFRFGSTGRDPSPDAVSMDVGEYDVLLGSSYTEIAGRSRSMHKSQGFGAAENRGTSLQYFEHTAGERAVNDLFDGIDLGWSRVPGGAEVGRLVDEVADGFNPLKPDQSIPGLLRVYRALNLLKESPWIEWKKEEVRNVILGCAGVAVEAIVSDFSASPGDSIDITIVALNRSSTPIRLSGARFPFAVNEAAMDSLLQPNAPVRIGRRIHVPDSKPFSQPYWLVKEPRGAWYEVDDQSLIGKPENPSVMATVTLTMGAETIRLEVPLRFKWVDPVQGQQDRPFVVVPPVGLKIHEPVYVFTDSEEKQVRVVITRTGSGSGGVVRLETPKGWSVSPSSHRFRLENRNDETTVSFSVRPGPDAATGKVRAIAGLGGKIVSLGLTTIRYPHITPQVLLEDASAKLVRVPMAARPGGSVGYIAGPGDEIPAALTQLGYSVSMLTDDDLAASDLSKFDAIMAGVRAYNTRPKLRAVQERLMEYVRNGGRYVVQYVTSQRGEAENLGPLPFNVSRDRVTVEEAPVRFLRPDHPLLTIPNRITAADFDGWVQERGLYFADRWDAAYETVLESNDPGEPPRAGGLLFARHGKGSYVYTGYSFFRQLPAGVPGAYRLLVNLLTRN